jgi:hypothetical protein
MPKGSPEEQKKHGDKLEQLIERTGGRGAKERTETGEEASPDRDDLAETEDEDDDDEDVLSDEDDEDDEDDDQK